MPPSAITGMPIGREFFRHLRHRGYLRHADTGDDPRGADAAGTDADLHRIDARIGQRPRAGAGCHVAPDQRHVRIFLLDPADAIEHALRMAVCGVDHQHVYSRLDKRRDAFFGFGAGADARADPKPPESSLQAFGYMRALSMSLTVIRPTSSKRSL